MFDLKLKFETKIRVKLFSKDFEYVLKSCSAGDVVSPSSVQTVEHTMTITDSEIIPDKDWLANAEKIIFNEFSESFKKNEKLNVEVVETKFVGFTEIVQK